MFLSPDRACYPLLLLQQHKISVSGRDAISDASFAPARFKNRLARSPHEEYTYDVCKVTKMERLRAPRASDYDDGVQVYPSRD